MITLDQRRASMLRLLSKKMHVGILHLLNELCGLLAQDTTRVMVIVTSFTSQQEIQRRSSLQLELVHVLQRIGNGLRILRGNGEIISVDCHILVEMSFGRSILT